MRKAFLISLWSILALTSSLLLSQERNTAYQNRTRPEANVGTEAGGSQSAGNPADRWRYRYYNGRWWYYHPSKKWSYWNGNAWTSYNGQTYGQRPENQVRPDVSNSRDDYDAYGTRPQLTIQREKNEVRNPSLKPTNTRAPRTIQREKNDIRDHSLEPMYVRPPGAIQHEKNDVRG